MAFCVHINYACLYMLHARRNTGQLRHAVVRTSPPVMLIASDRPSVAALVPVIGGITGTIASTSPFSAEDSAVSLVGGGLARRQTGRNV